MSIQRATPVNELLAKLIFLILPTAFVGYFLLQYANEYYSVLQNEAVMQSVYFAAGMGISALVYSFRFRFSITFAILAIVFYSIYKGLDTMAIGEFDAFFISVQFRVFTILFLAGWFVGYGFTRLRYWSIIVAATILTSCILLIAKAQVDTVEKLLYSFAPAVLYAVYIIFTAEQIYNYKDKSQRFWWFLIRRLSFFSLLALLVFGSVTYLMKGEIEETVAQFGGQGEEGENSMLQKNEDGSFDLKDYSKLRSSLGRSNELLFCAHIDNFFEGTDIPNPLYLTAFYYTKFDTLTETFERDTFLPNNDLFEPDPSKLPMFFTEVDSSVIKNSLKDKFREVVEVEIYNKSLSPNTYLAPHTGFFVQPITIEKDFRDQFKSAYRTKSYSSALNSAYFIYNSENEQLKAFQEERFSVLRKAKGYKGLDSSFMAYYTYMPSDEKFQNIANLAKNVTQSAKTPVDQVLAIRDYFLAKDEEGNQTFTYTDNPGIPDIPSASKLQYFLFENKQGYCAYYAGATLFMLRSLGIPSRIAVGFLTQDRSDKNKGWYWYYADQAHAWVQVYFPGYGWLDFDTTVGNSEAEESPQPDGTPPMQPPRAWLATEGVVEAIDTIKKTIDLKVRHLIFKDEEYDVDSNTLLQLDMKIAAVYRDSIAVPLNNIVKGDAGTAVSYAEAIKKVNKRPNETGSQLLNRLPSPTPIDEIYLKREDAQPEEAKTEISTPEKHLSIVSILLTIAGIVLGVFVIILLLPYLVYQYFKMRYKKAQAYDKKAYWAYQTVSYYLHIAGITRGEKTPMQYAQQVVDPAFGTSFTSFMNVYLKQKYAKQELSDKEQVLIKEFVLPFIKQVRHKTKAGKRLKGFLNPFKMTSYFYNTVEKEANH
ncbi:MAG: transglutaminase domain-containing protein [Flavipsychrobacter sp.]